MVRVSVNELSNFSEYSGCSDTIGFTSGGGLKCVAKVLCSSKAFLSRVTLGHLARALLSCTSLRKVEKEKGGRVRKTRPPVTLSIKGVFDYGLEASGAVVNQHTDLKIVEFDFNS